MKSTKTSMSCVMVAWAATCAAAWAQPPAQDASAGWRTRIEAWRQRVQDRRQQWRERMDALAKASPEERTRMRLDGWVDMLARTYALDDAQRAPVRASVERLRDEYRASLGDDAAELDRVRQQMAEAWRRRPATADDRPAARDPTLDPELAELRQRLEGLRRAHPFDRAQAIERIEALLPPEQAAAGRQRRQQWQAHQQRMRALEQTWRATAGQSWEQRREALQERLLQLRRTAAGGYNAPGADLPGQVRPGPTSPRASARPHPFDVYTRAFARRTELDPAQTTAARSILRDLKGRARSVELLQANDRRRMRAMTDSQARARRAEELNAPIRTLFDELKTRLDALRTERQRYRSDETGDQRG